MSLQITDVWAVAVDWLDVDWLDADADAADVIMETLNGNCENGSWHVVMVRVSDQNLCVNNYASVQNSKQIIKYHIDFVS